MKKPLFALIAGAALALAGAAHAGAINFDELNTAGDFASLTDINPYAGPTWGDFTTTVSVAAPVPEPGTSLMLALGLLTVVAARRRSAR
jgi:hypothetical protein